MMMNVEQYATAKVPNIWFLHFGHEVDTMKF